MSQTTRRRIVKWIIFAALAIPGVLRGTSYRDLFSWSRVKPPAGFIADGPALAGRMETIKTAEEFRAMLSEQDCLLFVDVDWSLEAALSRRRLEDFIRVWNQQNHSRAVVVFRVDLTNGEGHIWNEVVAWLKKQNLHMWETGGVGPAFWLRRGKIFDLTRSAATVTVPELLAKTSHLLEQ